MDTCDEQPHGNWFNAKPSRLSTAAVWASSRVAAGLQNVCGNRCHEGFGILMYHRVAPHEAGVAAPTLNVTPERLRSQLAGLRARGFEAWPLARLVEAWREGEPIPANAFAVTFDDGYENNFVHAWPVLRELDVPATIFVATKYLDSDQPFPFDDWSAKGSNRVPASAWRPMTTAQCAELAADGLVEIGAHTHRHGRFLGRSDEFRRDLGLCLDILRDRLGIERPTFAFPYGDHDAELVDAARQLGVTCCVTTRHRRVLPGDDAFAWSRFDVEGGDTAAVVAAKLSGWYTSVTMAVKQAARIGGHEADPSRRSPTVRRAEPASSGGSRMRETAAPS